MGDYLFKLLFFVAVLVLPGCNADNTIEDSVNDINIVVISDTHLMARELLSNDGNAFQGYLASSQKMVDYSQALLDQAVDNIKSMSTKPELVLILGDLSKDGELASHEYVKKKLDALKECGIPTLVVPGNHDWGKRAKAVYYDGENTIGATSCVRFGDEENSLEKIYADYGFRTCFQNGTAISVAVERESAQSTLTYACEPISGLVFIGIDSGNVGELSETTLDWVCDKAKTAFSAGKQVIAMMHYPLIPHIPGAPHIFYPSKKGDTGTGYEIVRNRLADAGIRIILTGHYHITDIAKDWNEDLTRSIYDVLTGSLIIYPCYYRVLTLSNDLKTLSVATKSITKAGSSLIGIPFSPEIAKSRLLQNSVLTSLSNDLVSAGLDYDKASVAAPYLANAYVYHSEGNEDENSKAQELLLMLTSIFSTVPSYMDISNSMLMDLSNLDDSDRENRTNDLTLVSLPLESTAQWP